MSVSPRTSGIWTMLLAALCLSAIAGAAGASVINCTQLSYSVSGDTCLTLQTDTGNTYHALYRAGSNGVGIIFFHGRGQNPNGDVVRQLRLTFNQLGYSTLSLKNPTPADGNTRFNSYLRNETMIGDQVFARVTTAIDALHTYGADDIVLAGFSIGSRFATAVAAAWQAGLLHPAPSAKLRGLIGIGMYGNIVTANAYTAPTPRSPTTLGAINVYDTIDNLALLKTLPVLDIYGSHDSLAVIQAPARRAAYPGIVSNYTQAIIDCPSPQGGDYARNHGRFVDYYPNAGYQRCHPLRNAYLRSPAGQFTLNMRLRGNANAPLETAARHWLTTHVPGTKHTVP